MCHVFAIQITKEDINDDLYEEYDFLTACSEAEAWFIAGGRYAQPDVETIDIDWYEDANGRYAVMVLNSKGADFWHIFDPDYSEAWLGPLMKWAVKNRRDAEWLLEFDRTKGIKALETLAAAPFRALVEQHQLEQEIITKASQGTGLKAPGARKIKAL